jgi:hypothetical protein
MLCCAEPNTGNFCNFWEYHGGYFYMHVTAVYNAAHIESEYDTTIYAGGYPLGLKEITRKDLDISTVIQSNSSITVGLNQPLDDNGLLIASNCLGQETDKITLQKEQQQIIINSPAAGIYFLSLKTNKEAVVRKIVVK